MGCSSSSPPSAQCSAQQDFPNKWHILRKVGEGSYAEVFAVENKSSGGCAAVKVPKSRCTDLEIKHEANVWKRIGEHEHVVNLIDDFVLDGKHILLMEKCEGSLMDHISDMNTVSEANTARMFHQMTSAVAHLERLSILHRDIKPDNFLCALGGWAEQILKLCDFGFARLLPSSGQLFGVCGTPLYMSPEMVGHGPYNLKTDVWSLGATWYRMLYGEWPYTVYPLRAKSVMQAIATGIPAPKYQDQGNISPEARNAVAALLHRPGSTRLFASQALELPFLQLAFPKLSTVESSTVGDLCTEIGSRSRDCTSSWQEYLSEDITSHESLGTCISPRTKITL